MNDHLWVKSNIYFDNECCFCGRPYVSLIAYKDKNKFWDTNAIGIGLRDDDDFDIGLIYKTNADEFENVLHELINWMHDHEQGISIYENIWHVYDFFPDCGVKERCGKGGAISDKRIENYRSGIERF